MHLIEWMDNVSMNILTSARIVTHSQAHLFELTDATMVNLLDSQLWLILFRQ